MKKLTSVPNLNILSQKLANPLPNVALHFLIGIPFFKKPLKNVQNLCADYADTHKQHNKNVDQNQYDKENESIDYRK